MNRTFGRALPGGLLSEAWAPFAVSNRPTAAKDQAHVRPTSGVFITRPSFRPDCIRRPGKSRPPARGLELCLSRRLTMEPLGPPPKADCRQGPRYLPKEGTRVTCHEGSPG